MPKKTVTLDPAKLPKRAQGYSVAELAKFFRTTQTSIGIFLSRVRSGEGASSTAKDWTVERIRTPVRFRFVRRKAKK